MHKNNISVREAQEKDVALIADYWFNSNPEYLEGLGVDISKMPTKAQFTGMLNQQISLSYPDKKAYALIWELDGNPIGHTNVNPLVYGEEASMHIHLWTQDNRRKGYGMELIKMSLPLYFENLQLKKVICEPYALNPAPNNILQKSGFTFIKEYITTPGAITFEQPVKRWEITRDKIFAL